MLNKSCNDLNTYELKGYKTREILTASLIMFVSSFFFFTMYYHILYEPFVFDSIFVFFIYIICIFSICICIILIYKAYKIQPVEITDEYLFYAPFRKEKVPISDIKRVIDQDKHLKILLNDGEKFTLQSYVFDNFDKFRLRLKSVLMRKDIPFIEDVLYKEYILDANPKLKYYDRILLLSVIVGGVLWVIFVQLLREQIRDLFPFFILVPVLFCLFLLKNNENSLGPLLIDRNGIKLPLRSLKEIIKHKWKIIKFEDIEDVNLREKRLIIRLKDGEIVSVPTKYLVDRDKVFNIINSTIQVSSKISTD